MSDNNNTKPSSSNLTITTARESDHRKRIAEKEDEYNNISNNRLYMSHYNHHHQGTDLRRRMESELENDSEAVAAPQSKDNNNNNNTTLRAASAYATASTQTTIKLMGGEEDSTVSSSEALADALSSSLACIAAGNSRNNNNKYAQLLAEDDIRSNNSSEEGPPSSSSSGGPAVVTSTSAATSSGGDEQDRYSSNGNASGGGSNHNSSSDSRGNGHVRASIDAKIPGRHHYQQQQQHHHHNHHSRSSALTSSSCSSADGHGLPVPVDDQMQQAVTHATVVAARLPPPHTDSSGAESDKGDHQGTSQQQAEAATSSTSLLDPHRESGFHTIRRTFDRFVARGAPKSSETDSEEAEEHTKHKHKASTKRTTQPIASSPKKSKNSKSSKKRPRRSHGSDNDDVGGNGSSSGSGTEGGYAGSASSNENGAQCGSSSPSVSSSEESVGQRKHRVKGLSASTNDPNRPMLSKKQDSRVSVSSEIADFSSASSQGSTGAAESFAAAFRQSASRSPSISSSSDEQDEASDGQEVARKMPSGQVQRATHASWPPLPLQVSRGGDNTAVAPASSQGKVSAKASTGARRKTDKTLTGPILTGRPPVLSVGCDVMAHILTFLEPPDILDFLTMPLSKDWLVTFTRQPELWRVLCLLEPFKAQVEGDSSDSSDESVDSYCPLPIDTELRQTFGKFRLLYTSFVRCMRYLSRIKDDALHGRPPSVIDYGSSQTKLSISANHNLQQFLARARGFLVSSRTQSSENSDISDDDQAAAARVARARPIGVSDDGSSSETNRKRKAGKAKDMSNKKKRVRYGHSVITQRLLGPTATGEPGNVELPWSCAIYSIVNWMVAFSDVEGIQTMCLKVLPFILEDEQQRITAQRAGLTDVVLRGMVMFPESASLHTAAFHTIVLLARPLGGREGMLFHSSMVNSTGIFSSDSGSQTGRTGIAVMLDSMRRFQNNEVLQAMSCWSLVNIALAPSQKEMLVTLGGIQVTANSMMEHPFNAEVQFRALFALINLVIPSVSLGTAQNREENAGTEAETPVAESTEKEMLDEMVDHIVSLVVTAMKNFCASEAILNRACLVLHNLSLTQEYHGPLLWTPHCYQMLEWCLGNYPTDQVLQQSAAGTLHRLQITLSSDDALRARFTASLQTQQQLSLEEAHREAVLFHEQHLRQQNAVQELSTHLAPDASHPH